MTGRKLPSLLLAGLLAVSPVLASEGNAGWFAGARQWVAGRWPASAESWLERIGPALREQNYQGRLVIVSGDRVETLAVFHSFQDGRERMRMATLSGTRREVVRDNRVVMVMGADAAPVGYDDGGDGRLDPAQRFSAAGKLAAYEARLGGSARVAGREAQVVEIQARDALRYGFRLWLDKQTAIPLRIALLGEGGQPLEQMAFTDLRLGTAPAERDLRASTAPGLQRVQSLGQGERTDPGWRIAEPPAGFSLQAARRLGESVQLLYSDGLANVSIYIEPALAHSRGESLMRRGAVNAHSLLQGGRRVVAIGKVPPETVAMFVRRLRPPAPPAGARELSPRP